MADDPADSVGYKKPPRHTRFKKGQSGNPRGRPRRQPISGFGRALLWALDFEFPARDESPGRRMTGRQAIANSVLNGVAQGDPDAFDLAELLENLPGDHQEYIYFWAGNWGVPDAPEEPTR